MSAKIIIFDFNRTLYDPDHNAVMPGAFNLLQAARAKGYRLVLLSKGAPSREQQIAGLGLAGYFDRVCVVDTKSAELFEEIAAEFKADKTASWVIGDRAQSELALGAQHGWRTIWLRAGKFAHELPAGNQPPDHTVTALDQIAAFI